MLQLPPYDFGIADTSNHSLSLCLAKSEVYGGKANGSILAGRNFFGSESLDVGSVLIFGDAPSASVTRRVMGLLDACYPFAPKAGLLTDEAIGVQGKVKRGTVTLFFFGGKKSTCFFPRVWAVWVSG